MQVGSMEPMLVLQLAAEAVALRARVVVYEAQAGEARTAHEREIFIKLRAAALAALGAIEDGLGVERTVQAHQVRRHVHDAQRQQCEVVA